MKIISPGSFGDPLDADNTTLFAFIIFKVALIFIAFEKVDIPVINAVDPRLIELIVATPDTFRVVVETPPLSLLTPPKTYKALALVIFTFVPAKGAFSINTVEASVYVIGPF